MGAAIAGFMDSSVPTNCRPGFESQAHYLPFIIYSQNFVLHFNVKNMNENKQKRPDLTH